MNRRVLIEGILILAIGLAGTVEGLRLTFRRDPGVLYDLLGPGLYVFVLGLSLIVVGVVHLSVNYEKVSMSGEVVGDRQMRIRLIGTILACAVYTVLINVVGYLVSTMLFFFLQFRIAGVESWKINALLTVVVSALSYIIFVQYGNIAFPRGLLFG